MSGVKRVLLGIAALAVLSIGATVAYQAVDRARQYGALLARGDQAVREMRLFAAIEAYSGAIALRPDSMLAHYRRGETYRRQGELDEAVRDFGTAAALDPAAIRPLEALGDVFVELERHSQAATTYGRALRIDDRSVRISYKLALARYDNDDFSAALAASNETLRLDARHVDATYLRGLCLREQGEVGGAIESFEHVLALSPGFTAAREELADLYTSVGRPGEALSHVQALAGLEADRIERHVALALAHARAGHADLAVATLASVLERSPDHPLVYAALGRVWLDLVDTRPDALRKAIEALRRAAANPAAGSDVLTLYGRALVRDGQIEAADTVLQQAVTRFPVDPDAWMLGATTALRLNNPRAAVALLTRAMTLAPNDASVRAALADATRRVR
jgi:tetratricopeptide (TPR) repeat protein